MPRYEHTCRACKIEWEEDYGITDDPPTDCPECGSSDMFRNVTTAGAVHFKGSGWSPDGYYKNGAYDIHKAQGKSVQLYDRKEDIDRDMRGEAEAAEKGRIKKVDAAARKTLGPDSGLSQAEADVKIKDAGQRAVDK